MTDPGAASPTTRDACAALDQHDPLAAWRSRFVLPENQLYFAGNSLGPPLKAVEQRLRATLKDEWARDLVSAWNRHAWIDLPRRLGERLAPLLGAAADEVIVADSTTINLFKALGAASALRPRGGRLLVERDAFQTDLYAAQSLAELSSDLELVPVALDPEGRGDGGLDSLHRALDNGGPVVGLLAQHVHYGTGRRLDLAAVTQRVQAVGGLAIWDLSHSVGAMPIDLRGADVDFAVGCTYKYLAGGPGSPAFLFAARRHHQTMRTPLRGWLGHARPFAFESAFEPAPGVGRFVCGTPPILSMVALETALDLFAEIDLAEVRRKSLRLGDLFFERARERLGAFGVTIASPDRPERRGSQVCLRFADGYPVVQALAERGVQGDFRAPDILRFGLSPLFLRQVDVWDAVEQLVDLLATGVWRAERFARRAAVT
ncbi:MAG: kynureninase [Acidobacteriota bacterium]